MEIKPIKKEDFLKMVYDYHYSIVMPRHTKHYLGCFQDNELVGGVSLGWGTQPRNTIKKLLPLMDTKDYFEIGKMVMLDKMPRNSESQMLSEVVKWIKNNLSIQYLFTWADGIVGKAGYVYQASNFYYGGYIWTDVYISSDGEKIHPRSSKQLTIENAKWSGVDKLFWLTADFCQYKGIKHYKGKQFRYIYPINKNAKKMLKESTVEWNISGFPKDSDLVWKVQTSSGKYEITTDRPLFSKLSINANKKNYNENFGTKQMELL